MSAPKYKQYYELMKNQNQSLYNQFREVHDRFATKKDNEAEFHQVGREFLDVVRDWERRLCSGMERGRYVNYSAKLSEKYWEVVNADFPLASEVGVHTKAVA